MPRASVKPLHVLILGSPQSWEDLGEWLEPRARVEHVDTFEAALEALEAEPYDIVISCAADLIPFKSVFFSEQASVVLETISQGVCIIDETGEMVWANPKMLGFPQEVRDRVSQCCVETFQWATAQGPDDTSEMRGRRFSISTSENQHFEMTATPVIDLDKRITKVASIVWDSTKSRHLQDKIDAIDQAGRELVRLDAEQFSRLDVQERLSLLEQRILRSTNELLHFNNFAIFVLDRSRQKLDLVLSSGQPGAQAHMELLVSTEGNGIVGFVAARGRSYICPDISLDPRYIPGISGAKSSLTVPLRLHDRIIGVANFESTKLNAFSEDDRQFAEIFGRYLAIALHILELLVSERHTTTGRLGSDVMAQITAPLNDILTEVESLVEDYIGHDDLRHRLRAISEHAVKIRESINEVTSQKPGLVGARSKSTFRCDPELAGKRVLVADDEDIIRDTIRDVLSGYGCEVTAVADGGSAHELVSRESFDLVLSDIKMPGKNGYEIFAATKEANAATPVILITGFGYDPNHAIVRARREGLSAVLFKPFKVDQLLSEIRTALKSAKPA
jgi:CheY-like chemotaxis protein/putative methionine-R-sulfoxide reductase with GAF domain/PAS domain-containing protein